MRDYFVRCPDVSACRGEALYAANSLQGADPSFAATLRGGGPGAATNRAKLVEAVNLRCCYFRHTYLVSTGTGEGKEDAAVHLAEEAEDFLQGGGQAELIAGTWWWLTRGGHLDSLAPNVRLVLQGVFMLAMDHGPAVPCATRYMALLLKLQFGVEVTDRTVSTYYKKLVRFGGTGVDLDPGRPGRGRRSSAVIDLRPLLVDSALPPPHIRAELTLRPGVAEALEAYAKEARTSREELSAKLERKRLLAEGLGRRLLAEQVAAEQKRLHEEWLVELQDWSAELLDEV